MKEIAWKRLQARRDKCFYSGVVFRFQTNDSGPRGYQFAMACLFDGDQQMKLISFEGRSWGAGPNTLPIASNFEGKPYTLSSTWIYQNFIWIAKPIRKNDIWFAKSIHPIPVV